MCEEDEPLLDDETLTRIADETFREYDACEAAESLSRQARSNSMSTASEVLSSAANGGFTESAFEAFLKGRDEPAWLVQRRKEAFEAFRSLPWPTMRDEEWRRTDIRALKLDAFGAPAAAAASPDDSAALEPLWKTLSGHYATGIEQVNGQATRAADPSKLGGAVFTDLTTAVKEHPQLVERFLMTRAVSGREDALAALHAAFWGGGTLLYVPRGVKVEAPLFSLVGLARGGRVDMDHTLVVLEDGAEATLVRETAGRERGDAPALHAGAVELFVGRGARLRFVNIQNWDAHTWHFSRERALVGPDAAIQWTVGGLGARLAKVNQEVALTGQGGRAQVNGVMFTTGRQHLAYFTRQDHAAAHTTSDLLYKGGLKDKSRVVWKGMIRVEKDAQRTDAYQKNDNLVLSGAARADSIPGLEIEANDVRCTHGATAGRVDEDMIFYAQARGVSRETAVRGSSPTSTTGSPSNPSARRSARPSPPSSNSAPKARRADPRGRLTPTDPPREPAPRCPRPTPTRKSSSAPTGSRSTPTTPRCGSWRATRTCCSTTWPTSPAPSRSTGRGTSRTRSSATTSPPRSSPRSAGGRGSPTTPPSSSTATSRTGGPATRSGRSSCSATRTAAS
jgi:Fe-S cluster assembly protein SufD